jgi:hypothetical protein
MGPRPFHPKNSATGEDRRALGHIGNIQNKLLKALYRKGSPKNSSTGGHTLTVVGYLHKITAVLGHRFW